MSLHPGELLNNRYRIIKQLGQGGFAAVYRAEDTALKTTVALKENREYWDVAQRQFEREALLLAGLRHPNLPRVTDFFLMPAQGQYLVMDFVEGYDLQVVIERVDKPIHEKIALSWIDQICDALIYLHSCKPSIIHRDIKPANIKITPTKRAMLVDFGIAKKFDPHGHTTTGARAVTPGYSPVEQYGEDITNVRADQYALGATMYALFTLQRPIESISRLTGKELTPPRELNASLSPALEEVILQAMQVSAEDRYPDIQTLRKAMQQALKEPEKTSTKNSVIKAQKPSVQPVAPPPGSISIQMGPKSSRHSLKDRALPEWIEIPEGPFPYGEGQKTVQLPGYKIAKFPVTNQQYMLFLEANPHHRAPTSWKGRSVSANRLRHPVTDISLEDAQDFCHWLGCRLPSEQEWEKAARGDDKRIFPWGKDWQDGKNCNHWNSKIGGTTPVDKYPSGVSPYGVWDMAGNVWEWTNSEHQGPHLHILRGGSWRSFGNFAVRVEHRDSLQVSDWRDDIGFRCVL